jgi:tetratricopeptide (TPR) repeat protein
MVSGRTIDLQGGVVPLPPADFRKALEALRERHPADFACGPDQERAFREDEAEACERRELWAEALRHLEALSAAASDRWEIHARRGYILGAAGKLPEAREAFEQAFRQGADDLHIGTTHALLCAALDDGDAFRSSLRRLRERFEGSGNTNHLNTIVWTAALRERAADDLPALVRLSESTLEARPGNAMYLNTLGAILFRAGQTRRALETLEKARALDPRGGTLDDWFFLSMALARDGRVPEARAALSRAVALLERRTEERPGEPILSRSYPWFSRLWYRLLREEAEALAR